MDYYIDDDLAQELARIEALSRLQPRNVMLVGPRGCGKTALFHYFVEHFSRKVWIKMPCSVILDPDEWYGTAGLVAGETAYHPSRFVEAVETPRAAILLDDWGRAISPKVMNGLVGLLDDTSRRQYIPGLRREVKLAPEVVFFATYNVGMGEGYIGSDPIDAALCDRFRVIRVDFPSPSVEARIATDYGLEEEQADKLVELVCLLRGRGIEISTRQLIQIAESRSMGATWADSIRYTCLHQPGSQASTRATEVLQILQEETLEGLEQR
jgi:MoxR-like ATPase